MKRLTEVEVGHRFQSIGTITGAPAFVYEVEAVFTSKVDRLRYARLVSVDDRTQMKSVVTAILLNPRHFIQVAPPGSGGSIRPRAA